MTKNIKYIETTIGLIPSDWEVISFGDLFDFKNGINASKEFYGEGVKFINVMEVIYNNYITNDMIKGSVIITKKQLDNYAVNKGDVLFNRTSETQSEVGLSAVYLSDEKVVFGGFVIRGVSKNNKLNLDFKKFCFLSKTVRNQIIQSGQGAVRTNIGQGDLQKLYLPMPPLPEQQKISSILSTWDVAIDNCKGIVDNLKIRNNGLSQQLLSGKIRMKGFDKKWKVKVMNECLNFAPRPILKPTENYLALGLRSHGKGIFHKKDFDPASIAMETMYEVKENDLIINITFAWEHAVAIVSKKDEGGLVSHRFPTYTFNFKNAIPEYFRHFILQKRFKFLLELISPGGAGRNRVMSKTDFLKLEIKIPDVEEQKVIANILDKATEELNQHLQKLKALQLQKKGLMQQLLTGKIRTLEKKQPNQY
ncbi:restriction endonuclease subunit S [Flavobacterium sp. LS1R49]|uniref:Restriction endonuclease subunit S n=1 Tax=Flavobacterium shii TaxID=2987687 RepID=A0A9X2YTL3_9FLAO|nr:restriction endonuclease subunit S [Flavobacterium shii]MCV9926629.1 restriction endonuclease subunit S [Flavobacterium shii]